MKENIQENAQRIAGVLLAVIGGLGTFGVWRTALTEGYFYGKPAMMMPVCVVFGLVGVSFPRYRKSGSEPKPQALSSGLSWLSPWR